MCVSNECTVNINYPSSMATSLTQFWIIILLFWILYFEKYNIPEIFKRFSIHKCRSSILFYFLYFNVFEIIQILVWNLPWDYGNDYPGLKCYLGYQPGSNGHDQLLTCVWFYCSFVAWPVPSTNVLRPVGRDAIPRGGMRFYHCSSRACSTIDFL